MTSLALATLPAEERPDRKSLRVVALGDSLTAGYGLAGQDSFPAQLEIALNQKFTVPLQVINAGVSGDTTAGGLARLSWVLSDNPDLVLVALGANDALRGLPSDETFKNLDQILKALAERETRVLLIGMYAPKNLGSEYVTAFDAIFPSLASRYDVPLYPFFLEGVALDPKLNLSDGIHPNARGVSEIVERILPHVADEISQILSADQ
jgi:acyl-CoA thioesterase-1